MSIFSYSVLSIDGGGIRGIIPCIVLDEIEKRSGKPIAELFDLIAGTSTGGILAGGLTITDEAGKPKNSAKKLLGLYTGKKEGEDEKKKKVNIFPNTFPGKLNYIRLLFKSLFSPKNLEKQLEDEFGDARLKDACTNLLITSYNTQEKLPFYFRSSQAKSKPEEDFVLKDICRATSAAPTYFPPKQLNYGGMLGDKKVDDLALIDGGVFANNPSVLAFVEAIQMWKQSPDYEKQFRSKVAEAVDDHKGMAATARPDNFAPPVLLVSLGTGHTKKTYPYRKIKGWGLRWLMPLMDIFMQGVSESVHYQMQYLLPPFIAKNKKAHPRYYRLNIEIPEEFSEMSDTSDKTLEGLQEYGRKLVEKYDAEINTIVRLLKIIGAERTERKQMTVTPPKSEENV